MNPPNIEDDQLKFQYFVSNQSESTQLLWRQDTKIFPACWMLIGQFKFQRPPPYARARLSTINNKFLDKNEILVNLAPDFDFVQHFWRLFVPTISLCFACPVGDGMTCLAPSHHILWHAQSPACSFSYQSQASLSTLYEMTDLSNMIHMAPISVVSSFYRNLEVIERFRSRISFLFSNATSRRGRQSERARGNLILKLYPSYKSVLIF